MFLGFLKSAVFAVAHAQTPRPVPSEGLRGIVTQIILPYLSLLFPIIVGLTLLSFVWGMVRFIGSAGDEKAVESGKKLMIWGIVIFFVMVSLWGIVLFLQRSLGIDSFGTVNVIVPKLPTGTQN